MFVTEYILGKGVVPRHETNGVNMRQSISELDSLLDDLNHAQRVGFSNSGVNRHEIITTESNMYVFFITEPSTLYGISIKKKEK